MYVLRKYTCIKLTFSVAKCPDVPGELSPAGVVPFSKENVQLAECLICVNGVHVYSALKFGCHSYSKLTSLA